MNIQKFFSYLTDNFLKQGYKILFFPLPRCNYVGIVLLYKCNVNKLITFIVMAKSTGVYVATVSENSVSLSKSYMNIITWIRFII